MGDPAALESAPRESMTIRSIARSKRGFLFAFALFAFVLFAAPRFACAQRLPSNAVPVHYALHLTPDLKAAAFSGDETIDVMVKEATNTITLNAAEMEFQSVTATFGCFQLEHQQCTENVALKDPAISLDKEKEQATFTFSNQIQPGELELRIRYTGILNNELRGFYLSKTAKRSYAVTQFEPTDARRAFPCFDEPAFKATFDISLTVDSGDNVISNSPVASDTPGPAAGKHTVVFSATPKMSTYLVAFLVGDFECTRGEQDGVRLGVCSTPDKVSLTPYALDIAKFTLHYYDDYFGIHFPLKKLDLIAIPDFEAGAMENFGAITYREDLLLIDPKISSVGDQENVTTVITHEMAHQWFGDLVTMQWWDNIWLNEGFATWMENKAAGAMHPEWQFPQIVASQEQGTLNIDSQPTTRAIRAKADTPDEINQMFDGIAYGKAGDVLLMVENFLGEETFRQGVHAYLEAHEYSNATAEDFWNAQTAVSHKPVDKIMESLVAQPGAPILTFAEPSASKVAVTQHRFYLSPSITPDPAQKWTLPVCFKTSAEQQCELLSPEESSLKTPQSPLFFADAGGKGLYRSAYAPAQYRALVRQVETGLAPAERISLIGDEWAQVRSNKTEVGDYLDLVAALKSDSNSAVVQLALGYFDGIADNVASSKLERDALAKWVVRNFAPVYASLGPPAAGDSPDKRKLRSSLFALLGYHGNDSAVIDEARQIADKYLADPASVYPTLAATALGVAAQHGDAALFDRLQQVYETSADPVMRQRALQLLVQFQDPALLDRALSYSVSSKVRNQDAAIQLAIAMQIPENRDKAWQFIKTHWEQVQAQLTTSMGQVLVEYTGSFCTPQSRDDISSFFTQHPVAAADVSLKHSLESIDGCIELRKLQEPNLKKWLAAQGGN
jgi:aminopeptidase N